MWGVDWVILIKNDDFIIGLSDRIQILDFAESLLDARRRHRDPFVVDRGPAGVGTSGFIVLVSLNTVYSIPDVHLLNRPPIGYHAPHAQDGCVVPRVILVAGIHDLPVLELGSPGEVHALGGFLRDVKGANGDFSIEDLPGLGELYTNCALFSADRNDLCAHPRDLG